MSGQEASGDYGHAIGPDLTDVELLFLGNSPLAFDSRFIQALLKRLAACDFGCILGDSQNSYLRMAKNALTKYQWTDDQSHLVDAAKYALLEAYYPSVPDAYFKETDLNDQVKRD